MLDLSITHRPTHDADFLGFGSAEIPHLEDVFRSICRIEVEDGIVFQPDSVKAAEIRKDANYAGVRLMLMGLLDTACCPIQVDAGFGDAVVPGPEEVRYPLILPGMPKPQLRAHPRHTVVAEKVCNSTQEAEHARLCALRQRVFHEGIDRDIFIDIGPMDANASAY